MRILLLTGPPGCGKSATVRALSNEMEFDIKEWINPVLEVFTPTDSNSEGSSESIVGLMYFHAVELT